MRACATKPEDPHADAAAHAAGCLLCWKALYSPDAAERRKLGGDPEVQRRAPVPKPLPPGVRGSPRAAARPARPVARPPCPHEGPVVNWAPCGDEGRHVRQCLHDDADWDLCARGPTNGTAQSCQTCPLHPAAGSAAAYPPPGPGPLADRVALINLDHRPDRLRAFAAQAGRLPELAGWVRVPAVDGRAGAVPAGFRGGPGAWGCRLSHLQVIADAIRDGVRTLAVFEDDCRFAPDFSAGLARFLAAVPADWEGLLLGCEGQAPAPVVAPGVRRVTNAQRTHAYVVRGLPALRALYDLWARATAHIDWEWFRWQRARPVYQPDPLLCGQAAGQSDIVWRHEPERFWQGARQ